MKHPKPKPKSSKKPRKPRATPLAVVDDSGERFLTAWIGVATVNAKEARRLASWLLKFSDWSESRGGK